MKFIAALHGNERLPVEALDELGVKYIIGNPRAYIQDVRFIESDLNASFNMGGKNYEEKRADELLDIIQSDMVIDFHTTTTNTQPFVIITRMELLPLAKRTGIDKVVYMKHNIKSGHSLIDFCKGISVELGRHDDLKVKDIVKRVVNSVGFNKDNPVTLYEVFGIIENPGEYHNFEIHENGFYPILAGEKSYNHFGMKAKLVGER